MRKYQFLSASWIMLLLFSAVILMQSIEVTKANLIGWPLLSEPGSLSISLQAPEEQEIIFQNFFDLAFTVNNPPVSSLERVKYRIAGQPYVTVDSSSPPPLAATNSLPFSLGMPVEYINYTISCINGRLWAKVDGTYPLQIIYGTPLDDASFYFTSDEIPMAYPTPPGTTNISITLDETELVWGNYTQTYPDALHYTALGDWTMISTIVHPVQDQFTLKIHYEHPIEWVNGSYTFLYDLNISPYLSPRSNKSTAFFNIKFETNYTNLHVNTVAINGTLNPVDYTVTEDEAKTVTLQLVSEYSKPLLGDLLISFTEDNPLEQTNSSFSAGLPTEYALVVAIFIATVTIAGYLTLKHKKGNEKNE